MRVFLIIICIAFIYKCKAELLYTALHEPAFGKYSCSSVPYLAIDRKSLCRSKNIDVELKKFVPLIQTKKSKFSCSSNPHLSSTKNDICMSTTSIEIKENKKQKESEEQKRKQENEIVNSKLNSSVLQSIQNTKKYFLRNEEVISQSNVISDCSVNDYQQLYNSIQIKIIPSGSDYYDEMLKRYARNIENIKPFNKDRVSAYINFINRNIYPNYINLILHNCNIENLSKQWGTLLINKKKFVTNIELTSYKEDLTSQDDNIESLGENHLSIKYKDPFLKNSSLDYELKSHYNRYKHKIRYSKLLEISPIKFINTSISYDNFDYLADIYLVDNYSNLVNNFGNYSPSNLLLDINYTTLKNQSAEYTVGYAHCYTKYRHNISLEKNYEYNINNIYATTNLPGLNLSFYLGNEFSLNAKYRNTTYGVSYKKHLKNYYFNALFIYGDRRVSAKYKAKYYNYDLKIGKKIDVSGRILKYINPYFNLKYIDILGYDKKNNEKLNKDRYKLKKEVGIVVGIGEQHIYSY